MIKLSDKTIEFENENLLNFIITTANSICAEENINEINLENKISLAIATRLKTEEYLIKKLPEVNLDEITSNQTSELFIKYKAKFPESDALEILENVNLMTPENIHINAFMYEPLIDMSVFHLKDLYLGICELN